MTFDEIFREYYVLYRGQATKIPAFLDREYTTAIILANAAIKKWERADGILWKELYTTLSEDGPLTISASTTTYDAPTNMMNPPGWVSIGGSQFQVIPTQDVSVYTSSSSRVVWFTGNPNSGFTLRMTTETANSNAGKVIDFPYYKRATQLSLVKSPAAVKPDMSDPSFMVQDMLASRAQQARNGFVFKAAKAESTAALANMKIKNDSGTYHNVQNLRNAGAGWGIPQNNFNDIRL